MAKSEIIKIRVRPSVKEKLDAIADREERTTAEVVRNIIDSYLEFLPARRKGGLAWKQ